MDVQWCSWWWLAVIELGFAFCPYFSLFFPHNSTLISLCSPYYFIISDIFILFPYDFHMISGWFPYSPMISPYFTQKISAFPPPEVRPTSRRRSMLRRSPRTSGSVWFRGSGVGKHGKYQGKIEIHGKNHEEMMRTWWGNDENMTISPNLEAANDLDLSELEGFDHQVVGRYLMNNRYGFIPKMVSNLFGWIAQFIASVSWHNDYLPWDWLDQKGYCNHLSSMFKQAH